MAGRLPVRWVIRPNTPEGRSEMLAVLMAISNARQQLADAEAELEDMQEDNPVQMSVFPAATAQPAQEPPE